VTGPVNERLADESSSALIAYHGEVSDHAIYAKTRYRPPCSDKPQQAHRVPSGLSYVITLKCGWLETARTSLVSKSTWYLLSII